MQAQGQGRRIVEDRWLGLQCKVARARLHRRFDRGESRGWGGAAAGRSARESGTVGGVAGERRARQDAGCATCTPCSIAQSQSSLLSYAKPASRQWLLFLAGWFAAFLHSCHIGRHEGTHAHTRDTPCPAQCGWPAFVTGLIHRSRGHIMESAMCIPPVSPHPTVTHTPW